MHVFPASLAQVECDLPSMKLYWYHFVLRLWVAYFVSRPEILYRDPEILYRDPKFCITTLKFCVAYFVLHPEILHFLCLTCFMFYERLGLGNVFYVVLRGTEAQLNTWRGVLCCS